MKTLNTSVASGLALLGALALILTGCRDSHSGADHAGAQGDAGATHTHEDGTTHGDHEDEAEDHGHEHDESPLGTVTIGGMQVELAQGHGAVAAGKEGHLVVKLPYNDKGATVVRAWIGTEDRTLSFVGKGEYAASHDDFDVHAVAPSPLPADAMWWIEIEKPDGTKAVGSAKPITE